MISFGTDGWRAVAGKEFTEENTARVTLAIGKYIHDKFGHNKIVLIGYDPRKDADFYARICAEHFAGLGFKVLLSSRVIPTPVLAYNAKIKNACAVMFTASHNPPEYLGMKFIPDYAGPASDKITDEIVSNLDAGCPNSKGGSIQETDFFPDYYKHLKTLIDFDSIKTLKTRIVYDGLYSAAIGYFDKILEDNKIPFDSIHLKYDSDFGGGMPDPKPQYLGELIKKVKETPGSIGLSNDGDGDRFGVIDENGEYVSPNLIITILLKHLLNKGYKGAVAKTTGSSLLIDLAAEKLRVKVIETPVGFKYIGEQMRMNDVIIGGEESGGLSIKGHIPEKDGILANLLILEAMASSGKTLTKLQEEIYELAGCKFRTDRNDYKLNKPAEIIEQFKNIKSLGGYEITKYDTKDGIKLMLGSKTKILIRPSGTEPLLRVYFESDDEKKIKALENEVNEILAPIAAGQN